MTLGEKLRSARLEAGLSQRQLCGGQITRNMLSQIENGAAQPSMDTLRYLAGQLGKPLSYFLDEEAAVSPNQGIMSKARTAFDRGDFEGVLEALKAFREPDPVFCVERNLLESLSLLGAAEKAIEEDRRLYALELLARAEQRETPYTAHLRRQRLLLLARAGGNPGEICPLLPSLDDELLLRANAALEAGDALRAVELLRSALEQDTPRWNYLMGEALRAQKQYSQAAACYHRAEAEFPEAIPALEICYRDLGDFEKAYFYACKQR